MLSHLKEICVSYTTPPGGHTWKLVAGSSWTAPYVPFPCADFHLYAFAIINCTMNITTFLSPVCPSSKSLSLRVVLGPPTHSGNSWEQLGRGDINPCERWWWLVHHDFVSALPWRFQLNIWKLIGREKIPFINGNWCNPGSLYEKANSGLICQWILSSFPPGKKFLRNLVTLSAKKKYQDFLFLSELAGLHLSADTIVIGRAQEQGETCAIRNIPDLHLPNMAISHPIIIPNEWTMTLGGSL